MRILFVMLALGLAAARAQQSNISLLLGSPEGLDIRYEHRFGSEAFGLRTGFLNAALWKWGYPSHQVQYDPEFSYAHPFRFGERTWFKPGLGLGYYYEEYKGHFTSGTESESRRRSGVFVVPRLDYTVKYGWFKFSVEYGARTGIFRTNVDEEQYAITGKTYTDRFPLTHAFGLSLGCFL
jgi:hypothetical protein